MSAQAFSASSRNSPLFPSKGPPVVPVVGDAGCPGRTEVVVVGGGIIGVCTALALARRGVPVVLCEKGHIAGEQSSRNWGWCRKQGRDSREMPLIVEALRLWQGMSEAVEADVGFRQSGVLYVAEDERDLAQYEAWLAMARPWQLDSRIIGGDEVARLMPGSGTRFRGALYTASDGRAEPQKAAPAIAEAARRAGAVLLTGCAVRGIETRAGRVSGVVTERGAVACSAVVLAGGAWSRIFCRDHGITLPQLKVLSSVLRTAPVEGGPDVAAWAPQVAYRRRQDGGYTIAPEGTTVVPLVPDSFAFLRPFIPALRQQGTRLRLRLGGRFAREWAEASPTPLDRPSRYEAVRVLDPEPDGASLRRAAAAMQSLFPGLGRLQVVQQWAGYIDATPDAVPVISPVDALPGLVVATGFSGHGFGIGPSAGQLAADLATGGPPLVDPAPFRLSRFFDGSPIRVEAGV